MSITSLPEILRLLRGEYGDPHWWPGDTPFEIAVGAILTQRASWKNVEIAISKMKVRGLLDPHALSAAPLSEVVSAVTPAGFYRQKARYIVSFAKHVESRYSSDISAMAQRPMMELREELLEIPGIGPETADSILLYAVGMPSFVVDAYTHRLLGRLGLGPTKEYERLKARFERELEHDVKALADMHALIVEHCKRICLITPKCGECFISERCPSCRE